MDRRYRLILLVASLLGSSAVAAQTSLLQLMTPREEVAHADDRGAVSGSIGKPPQVSEAQIQSELRERGITAIREWRRDGSVYRAEAEWFGEPVDLHVDTATGAIKQPERLKGTQIEAMLKALGWQGVRDVKRGGDTFSVRAERDNRLYELKIDSKTGEILDWKPA